MSLKTYINDEVQSFRKKATGDLNFGIQFSPTNAILGIHDAYPNINTDNPTLIELVKIKNAGTYNSLTGLHDYEEEERIALPLTSIQYDIPTGQYLVDKSVAIGIIMDNTIYFIEFSNGLDVFKTEVFCSNKTLNSDSTEKIFVTLDMSSPSAAGFNLTFTGNVFINFKDGSGDEELTSGVEKENIYTTPSAYIVEISGNIENITQFIADNSKITEISNFKTAQLTALDLSNNLLLTLDLTLAPIGVSFLVNSNPNLSSIIFASSGNDVISDFQAQFCNLNSLDLTNVRCGNLRFYAYSNPNLSSIIFASSGNVICASTRVYDCDLSVFDLTNFTVKGVFWAHSNPNLSSIIYASSGNDTVSNLRVQSCNLTTLDLTNVSVSGTFWAHVNVNLSSIILSVTGNGTIDNLLVNSDALTSFDLSNVALSGTMDYSSNSGLSALSLPVAGNGSLISFLAISCSLPDTDFTVFTNSDGAVIIIPSNSLTSTEHDNQLINLDVTGWINGNLEIIAGNTARTAASDTAYNNLIAKGWTII